jgi:hypothetical protein
MDRWCMFHVKQEGVCNRASEWVASQKAPVKRGKQKTKKSGLLHVKQSALFIESDVA